MKCSKLKDETMGNRDLPLEMVAIYCPIPEKKKYKIYPRKSNSDCLIQRPKKRLEEDNSKINPYFGRADNRLNKRNPNVVYDRQYKFTKAEMFQNCITNLDHSKTLGVLGQVVRKIRPSPQTNHEKHDYDRRTNISTIPWNTQQCPNPLHVRSLSQDVSFSESVSENATSLSERKRKSDTTCHSGENSYRKPKVNKHIYENMMLDRISESSYTTGNFDNYFSTSIESIDDLLRTDSNVYRSKTLSSKTPKYCSSDLLYLEDIPAYDPLHGNRIKKKQPHIPIQNREPPESLAINQYTDNRDKTQPRRLECLDETHRISYNEFQEPHVNKNKETQPKHQLLRKYDEGGTINQKQYYEEHGRIYEKPIVSSPSTLQEQSVFSQTENTQETSASTKLTGATQNKFLSTPIVPQRPTCLQLPREPQLPSCIQTPVLFPQPTNVYPSSFQNLCVTNPILLHGETLVQSFTPHKQCLQNPNIQQQPNFYHPPANISEVKDVSQTGVQSVDFQNFPQQNPYFLSQSGNNSHCISQNHTMFEDIRNQNILHSPYFVNGSAKDKQFNCILLPAVQKHCEYVQQQLSIPADSSKENERATCNTDQQVQTWDIERHSAPPPQQSCLDKSHISEISHNRESMTVNLTCSPKSERATLAKTSGELENPSVSKMDFAKNQSSEVQTSNSLFLHLMERNELQALNATTNLEIQVDEDSFPNSKLLRSELSAHTRLNVVNNFESEARTQVLQQIGEGVILQSSYSSVIEENTIYPGGNEVCRVERNEGTLPSPIPWKSSGTPYPVETHYLEIKIPLSMKQSMKYPQPITSQYGNDAQILEDQISTVRQLTASREGASEATTQSLEHKPQICNRSLKSEKLDSNNHYSSVQQPIVIYHKIVPSLIDKSCNNSASLSQHIVQKKKRLNVSFKDSSSEKVNVKEFIELPGNGAKKTVSDTKVIYEMSSLTESQSIINCHFINSISRDNENCSPEIQVLHNAADTSFSLQENSDYGSNELVRVKLSQRDVLEKNDESGLKNENIRDIFLKEDYCELTSIDSNDNLHKISYLKNAKTAGNVNSCNTEKQHIIYDKDENFRTINLISTLVNRCVEETERKIGTQNFSGDGSLTLDTETSIVGNDCTTRSGVCPQPSRDQIRASEISKKNIADKQNCLLQYFKRQPAWIENVVSKVTQDLLKKIGVTSNTSISLSHSYTIPLHTLPDEQSSPTTIQMLTEGSTPAIHTLADGATCRTSASNVCIVPAGRKCVKKSLSDTSLTSGQESPNKYVRLDHVIPQRMADNTHESGHDSSTTTLKIFQQSLAYNPVPPTPPQYTVMPFSAKPNVEDRPSSTKSTQYSIESCGLDGSEQPIVICECKKATLEEQSLTSELPQNRNDVSIPPTIFGQHTESTIGSIREQPLEERESFRPSHIFDIILSKVVPSHLESCASPEGQVDVCGAPCITPSQLQTPGTIHDQQPYQRPPDTGPVETTYYPSADQPLRLRIRKGPAPARKSQRDRSRVVREFVDASGVKRIRHICRRGGRCMGKPASQAPRIFAQKPESTVGAMPYIPVVTSVKRRFCRYCTLEICPGEEISRGRYTRSGVQMMEKELLSTMLDGNPYRRTRCTLDSYSNWEFPVLKE